MEEKYKIPDTNILLTDPQALYSFRPHKESEDNGGVNIILLPLVLERELEKFKGESYSQRGANAREVFRQLDMLEIKYGQKLHEGVWISDDYCIRSAFFMREHMLGALDGLVEEGNDKIFLEVANQLKQEGKDAELITIDRSMRVIGSSLGLNVSGWRDLEQQEIYKGWRQFSVDYTVIENIYSTAKNKDGARRIPPEKTGIEDPLPNEYFLVTSGDKEIPLKFKTSEQGGMFITLKRSPNFSSKKGCLEPKNRRQEFLMDALYDPDIDCVFSIGDAGTGKTFLATFAGFEQSLMYHLSDKNIVIDMPYERLIITRPLIGINDEEDIGALPGELHEKLTPWNRPVYDNLDQVMELTNTKDVDMDYLKDEKFLDVLPIQMARGSSLKSYYWIVDEAQNLAIEKIMLIGTRSGEYSKLVFTGDPLQSDINHSSPAASPLVRASNKFADYEHSATIYFEEEDCVRSRLAREFLKRLRH